MSDYFDPLPSDSRQVEGVKQLLNLLKMILEDGFIEKPRVHLATAIMDKVFGEVLDQVRQIESMKDPFR